ncbi:hypothetical protein T08_8027 [Trichinella sp. T8]|nr:hypothetical protein T08_8027 [Trichinella sp. T8]
MFALEAAQAGFLPDFKSLELNTYGAYQSTLLPPSSLQVATCAIHILNFQEFISQFSFISQLVCICLEWL